MILNYLKKSFIYKTQRTNILQKHIYEKMNFNMATNFKQEINQGTPGDSMKELPAYHMQHSLTRPTVNNLSLPGFFVS